MKPRRWPRIYPTKMFAALIFVLAVMWYASASQNNAANYLLFFCTVGIVAVSLPHTVLNLSGLKVSAESVKPTFAGEEVALPLEIVNESRQPRYGCVLRLHTHDAAAEMIDEIPAGKAARATLRFTAQRRGEYQIDAVELRSSYPFGFLAARIIAATPQRFLVYPKPEGVKRWPQSKNLSRGPTLLAHAGEGDDYAGLRAYLPGESQRQIDWKAVARGQPLMTKQFTAEADDVLRFDYDAVPLSDPEQRLSQLVLWIVEAERARRRYSLHLPGSQIPAGCGQPHYHRCLRTLALHR